MNLFDFDEYSRFLQTPHSFTDLENYICSKKEELDILKVKDNGEEYSTSFTVGERTFVFYSFMEKDNKWKISFHNELDYREIKRLNETDFFDFCLKFLLSLKMLLKNYIINDIQFLYFNKMERIDFLFNSVIFRFIMNDLCYKYSKRINRGSVNQITYIKQ